MYARERLGIDLIVLTSVIIAANPAMTGIALHEWVGVALVVPAFIHLVSNWEWVVRIAESFLRTMRTVSRLNFVVDLGLFVSLVAVTLSGVLVMPGFSAATSVPAGGVWHSVHLITSDLTVVFALTHLMLHAKWIAAVVRRMVAPAGSAAAVPVATARH